MGEKKVRLLIYWSLLEEHDDLNSKVQSIISNQQMAQHV